MVFWCYKRGNEAISYLFKASLPPALLEMKKKIDLVDKEHNSEKWKSGSFDDESGNKLKRQRWKMFWVVFPKRANVTPVFKADSKDVVENYRSISLLSIPSKCQERIVYIPLFGSLSDRLAAWVCEGTFMCNSVSIIDHQLPPWMRAMQRDLAEWHIISCRKKWVILVSPVLFWIGVRIISPTENRELS